MNLDYLVYLYLEDGLSSFIGASVLLKDKKPFTPRSNTIKYELTLLY